MCKGTESPELLQRQLREGCAVGKARACRVPSGHLPSPISPSPLPHPPSPPHLAFQQEFWKDSTEVFA